MARGRPKDLQRERRAEQFSHALGDLLHALDLTHKDVARALGLRLGTVDSWTRIADPKLPGPESLARLFAHLEAKRPGCTSDLRVIAGLNNGLQLASLSPPPPTPSPQPRISNLPAPVNEFIGREKQLADIAAYFSGHRANQGAQRLLTLVGAGGVGKTRLAIEAARALQPHFVDGVWLIEFAQLARDGDVVPELARALGVRATGERGLIDEVCAALHSRHALLILDNCEHMIESGAMAAQHLLARCPKLALLCTSREALRIDGEAYWRVPSLGLAGETDVAAVGRSEAAQLLLARVRVHEPEFALSATNAPAIAAICERLDGIALALELAAHKVAQSTPEGVLTSLVQRLDALNVNRRGVLPRQQTLRATLEWSYSLLTPQQQRTFAALGVFADRFQIGTASAVLQLAGVSADARDIEALAEKSLLQPARDANGMRYAMLETIKEFAWREADSLGVQARTESALLEHFHAHLSQLRGNQLIGGHVDALARAQRRESANIERALQVACRPEASSQAWKRGAEILVDWFAALLVDGRIDLGHRYATMLEAHRPDDVPVQTRAWFGWVRGALLFNHGQMREAEPRVLAALQEVTHMEPGLSRRYLEYALNIEHGRILRRLGRPAEALNAFSTAERLSREHAELLFAREPCLNLAEVEFLRGNIELGLAHTQQAETTLVRVREAFDGDPNRKEWELRDTARVHNMFGWGFKRTGEYAQARRHYQAAIEVHRAQGDSVGVLLTLANLSGVDVLDERLPEAEASAQESLALALKLGDGDHTLMALTGLAQVHLRMGRWAQARAGFTQAWDMLGDAHFPVRRGELLVGMGAANVLGGEDPALGTGQLRRGRASFEENGMKMDAMTQFEYDRAMRNATGDSPSIDGTVMPGSANTIYT